MLTHKNHILEMIGLCLIAAYVLMASVFMTDFAKIHVMLPYLKVPFFIGEMVMSACALILGLQVLRGRILLNKWHKVFLVYVALIVLWAVVDYLRLDRQALAFRNAVMFIYPVFAFFIHVFYRPFYISTNGWKWAAAAVFLAGFINAQGYFTFAFLLLMMAILCGKLEKPWRYGLVLGALILWPHQSFLSGARTWVVASALTFAFFVYIYVRYFLKASKVLKISAGLLCAVIFLSAVFTLADKENLKTLLTPREVFRAYDIAKDMLAIMEPAYDAKKLDVHLYNSDPLEPVPLLNYLERQTSLLSVFSRHLPLPSKPNRPGEAVPASSTRFPKATAVNKSGKADAISVPAEHGQEPVTLLKAPAWMIVDNAERCLDLERALRGKIYEERTIKVAYNNISFRVLIWEDMLRELWEKKALFGVGLGTPQRSRSIETISWAETEWSRDGWITPHNSLLHLIYRAGLLGLVIIAVIFVVLRGLIKDFIRARSWAGILLTGIIIYGLLASNFLLILEVPYYAISFWTFFGLTLVYRRDLLNAT